MANPVAIITDFGTEDWYMGALQGVILTHNLSIPIVNVNHSVNSGDIKQANFILANCFECFPQGTVFLVVVDPGVGSNRKPICISAGSYFFVGPDNGVFTCILEAFSDFKVREINLNWAQKISSTFHGRDIFAPCAALLAMGKSFTDVGSEILTPIRIELSQPIFKKDTVYGKVVYIDKFGNCLTNIRQEHLRESDPQKLTALLKSGKQAPFKEFYSEVLPGNALCLIGSGGWLEISLNQGRATEGLDLKVGEEVILSFN